MKFISKFNLLKADEMSERDLILLSITKYEVEKIDTQRTLRQIQEFKKAGKKIKNSVLVTFDGYDNDRREVWEIPEVVRFMRLIYADNPELFYFLDIDSFNFATFINSLPSTEVAAMIDHIMIDYARHIGDAEKVITISEYVLEQSKK